MAYTIFGCRLVWLYKVVKIILKWPEINEHYNRKNIYIMTRPNCDSDCDIFTYMQASPFTASCFRSTSLSLLRTQSYSLKFFITQEEPKKRLLAKINCPQHGMSFKANKKEREREEEYWTTRAQVPSLSLSLCLPLSVTL